MILNSDPDTHLWGNPDNPAIHIQVDNSMISGRIVLMMRDARRNMMGSIRLTREDAMTLAHVCAGIIDDSGTPRVRDIYQR